ncbi:MAG: MBL fold metallo-hydrolase, partial [Candidatus Micrarchaeota archaeon]|nr:MBL fold metallo-hydrolase [Candidatus Micrarchaeota archaeon]
DQYDISLYDAGHICGSAISLVEKRRSGRKVAYTGDFKLEPQLLEGGAEVVACDVLIIESTYAAKDHPNREQHMRKLIDEIRETVDNGGTALLPVFAVGRAQEILALLTKNELIGKTYLDGMAKSATEIVMGHPDFIKQVDLLEDAMTQATWIKDNRNRSNALNGGNIIVTTSGMLNGGPVLDYITRLNRKSKIFLTGYQVENTNGRKLVEGRPINIDGVEHRVKVPLSIFDFSAHAGKSDLHEYVKRSNPETVICVHGDPENSNLLAEELKMEGFEAFAPKVGDKITVDF